MVRKAVESNKARTLCIEQFRPSIAAAALYTCSCGKVCKSSSGLAAHRAHMHGSRNPAVWYASYNGLCECCGLRFASRQLLLAHLTRGSKLCLLNLVMRNEPFSAEMEAVHREGARKAAIANRQKGVTLHKATCPAFRVPWVCNALYDLQGNSVTFDDKRHPWKMGAGKLCYGWKSAGVDFDAVE